MVMPCGEQLTRSLGEGEKRQCDVQNKQNITRGGRIGQSQIQPIQLDILCAGMLGIIRVLIFAGISCKFGIARNVAMS